MKLNVAIESIETINEIPSYWSEEDFKQLLNELDFPDAESVASDELREMLFMAITDFEPDEAAAILLQYKLGDKLNKGQIQSLSHEMLTDKVAEEYPDPAFHFDLFNINQLLFKAYNGRFPNTEATILRMRIEPAKGHEMNEVSPKLIIKALSGALTDHNLIRRLFQDQIDGKVPFTDAEKVLWQYEQESTDPQIIKLITSSYWLESEDISHSEYVIEIKSFSERSH